MIGIAEPGGQLVSRPYIDLAVDPSQMNVHGLGTDPQECRDLFIACAAQSAARHLFLPVGQRSPI